jgi:hypothetical protein
MSPTRKARMETVIRAASPADASFTIVAHARRPVGYVGHVDEYYMGLLL